MPNDYLEESQRIIDSAYKLPIRVLVWGPGKGNTKGYAKREKIRNEIRKKFPNSMVYFSEDQELRRITGILNKILLEESVHAKVAHLIIVLDLEDAYGTKVEIGHFSRFSDIAEKMWVLRPKKFSPLDGLAKEELRNIEVEFFSDSEFNDCTLASVKCVNIVLSRAMSLLDNGEFPE